MFWMNAGMLRLSHFLAREIASVCPKNASMFCGIGSLGEPEVCTVNRISALFECGQVSGSKAWASLVHIEAKCCGKVTQPHYLTEVDHSFPIEK